MSPRSRDVITTPNRTGMLTRLKIQEALIHLLETRPYREVTMTEVARRSRISPAAVYQYHPNIETMILRVAEALEASNTKLPAHLSLVVSLLRFESEKFPRTR